MSLPSNARDIVGDTIGSFSALALDPKSWRREGKGWRARMFSLPDRGFNTPRLKQYSDYPGRIHQFELSILETGQAGLTYLTSTFLRTGTGGLTTGLDPEDGVMRHLGRTAPAFKPRKTEPRLTLDAEGLARRSDGTFYVSDEFSCCVYYCDAAGQMRGVIPPPRAIDPHKNGLPHFTSDDDDPPETGRQPNDGFEGLAIAPDGKTLWALMQSPLAQDMGDDKADNRFVRLVVYDIAKNPCPKKPIGHYVVELPVYRDGDGDEAAEANCILPLGGGAFWLLARDGGGFGDRKGKGGTSRPIRSKQILHGRLDPAANLAGTQYDIGTKSVFRKGRLDPDVSHLPLTTAIDLCDEGALNGAGLTIHPKKRGLRQISAKWESLCLTPPLGPRSRERFLLVGNDNDFLTRDGSMPDRAYDARIDNPNMILIYRVMMP